MTSVAESREQAREMKRAGKTYAEIGQAMGFNRQYAQRLVAPPRSALRLMAQEANGCCQICGEPTTNLQGHHENYDGDPTIFVCPRCHGLLEAGKMTIAELKSTNSKAPVSPRDMEVFNAIVEYKTSHDGCAPGYRELMKLAGMGSTSVVAHHLGHLERAGLIQRGRGKQQILVRGGRWTLNS